MTKWLAMLSLCTFAAMSTTTFAQTIDTTATDQVIQQFYSLTPKRQTTTISQRIDLASKALLNRPYQLTPLGEGAAGQFNNEPLYRTDKFDCLTYVETVVALAYAYDLESFKQTLRQLRYRHGEIGFIHRHHFVSLDWNTANRNRGVIRDLTRHIKNIHGNAIALKTTVVLDKPNWYRRLSMTNIQPSSPISDSQRQQKLVKLRELSTQVHKEQASIWYLPLAKLFTAAGKPRQTLFSQIPSGSIIEIVQPSHRQQRKTGASFHVSHIGFAIKKEGQLMFRHASSKAMKVVDIPLTQYLHHYLHRRTVKGISIFSVINL